MTKQQRNGAEMFIDQPETHISAPRLAEYFDEIACDLIKTICAIYYDDQECLVAVRHDLLDLVSMWKVAGLMREGAAPMFEFPRGLEL